MIPAPSISATNPHHSPVAGFSLGNSDEKA